MRAPAFWYADHASPWARLMSPLAAAYGWGGRARQALTTPRRVACPVICIGNLVAGGAGKTPTAIAMAALIAGTGAKPAFLSRGYRGRLGGPTRVDPGTHRARDVGDEALLLASLAPTWIARDRLAGAAAAAASGCDAIIMDDGLQNPTLHKDLSLLVVDGEAGFGNGHLMPAGPLRQRVTDGTAQANAALIIGDDHHGLAAGLAPLVPVLHARMAPTTRAQQLAGARVVAFAGIALPQKLFRSLEELGCEVVARYSFPDHHVYTPEQIMAICERAASLQAQPVTTEKDFVRLSAEARPMVKSFPITLEWAEPDLVRQLIAHLLQPHPSNGAQAPHSDAVR